MLEPYTQIGGTTYPTYTLLLGLSILVSAGIGLLRLRGGVAPGRLANVYLVTLVFAVIGARAEHVLLHWDHFGDNLGDITNLYTGGLNWHGAVLGGLLAVYMMGRWRGLDRVRLRDSLVLALPLIALGSWWGCGASHCAYGREVATLADYPAWVAAESADVYGIVLPRYNTQIFGMVLALAGVVFAGLLVWRGWLPSRRFWLVLALLAGGQFLIGFFRDDPMPFLAGLRADQWLDALVCAWAVVLSYKA
ncbi:MAG: prolipoprotein diacylglyceryl transferase [Anaerolineaceae bacterium]|nr:prolipoprotein diacylglyceryl transferase [Anaerolineaceae bacterium]